MSRLRSTTARFERLIAKVKATRPPVVFVLEVHDGESPEAWQARKDEAERRVEAVKADGGTAHLIEIDREEGE